MKRYLNILMLLIVALILSCNSKKVTQSRISNDLYKGFLNPTSESRPFVRWWWNGNCITADEIKRELSVLKDAGIGGVEINPIAMPEGSDTKGVKPIKWLSKEWNDLLVLATQEAKKNGMISDLIVGSGWPFGGEFLKTEELIQRVIINKIPFSGGETIDIKKDSLIELAMKNIRRRSENNEILFISLVPSDLSDSKEILDITDQLKGDRLKYKVRTGKNYKLIYGVKQRGHRKVVHGALGAAGPVMDHYRKDVTLAYLGRLKKISEDTSLSLSELIRALFCDSIELAGSNWTDQLDEQFYKTYGYSLKPYFPFLFYYPDIGYENGPFTEQIKDEISRVRYDYNKLLVDIFLNNFTQTFQDFCTSNGVKCRYQAYGIPFLMGISKGNMIADIPESNNWIYRTDMDADEWDWNQNHGYMIWNLYAASGAHLTGKNIVSCEAMTNIAGIFKTSLEEIKRNDDMNFITGINHSVLHGFNYSPLEKGLPGWVRYGAYFSEQNTWWPYFPKWVEYNSRLSYVLQHSQAVKKIAIMGPTGDIWSNNGLIREPIHNEPWYCYRLWESISQMGSSCDYINESVIQNGIKKDGSLKYGSMSYQTIILCDVSSIAPETAKALNEYAAKGGKVVLIDKVPSRSLSLVNKESNDKKVKNAINELTANKSSCYVVESPKSREELLSWTKSLFRDISVEKDVDIKNPDKNLYQIKQQYGDKDIYFFVNSNRSESVKVNASFAVGNKTPWKWNPEIGSREVYEYQGKNGIQELEIKLQPLESLLLVFEPDMEGDPKSINQLSDKKEKLQIAGPWELKFEHVNGDVFKREFNSLDNLLELDDEALKSFAGLITYSTSFTAAGNEEWLELAKVNRGISEVYLNGKKIGLNWYGRPLFFIGDEVKADQQNLLEIKYTTVLYNYGHSLKDNPVFKRWISGNELLPVGLEGDVFVYCR